MIIEYSPKNIRTWSLLGANGTFGLAICKLAEMDDNIVVLTADVRNFSGLKRFSQDYPNQFYNVGICEQNMIGIASGLTKENYKPYVTSYAVFATLRCADQIKFNLAYMERPVRIIGTTSGLNSSIAGGTHLSLEDIALMRAFPNITIISPADCTETMKAIFATANYEKPIYIRLSGHSGTPIVYKQDYIFEIGKGVKLKEGTDIAIIATGSMVFNSLKAAKILEENGYSTKVIDMHTIKPLDNEIIKDCFGTKLIVTVEEHSIIGGLGSAVSEVLVSKRDTPPLLIIGTEGKYKLASEYKYMCEKYKLSPEGIANTIINKYLEV